MLDTMIKAKITEDINMAVPLYLMMSYAYYLEDKPIATDATFDIVAKMLLESYDLDFVISVIWVAQSVVEGAPLSPPV